MEYLITRLTDRPELKAQAAAWFHAKWGVPEQAYLDSMDDALRRAASVPQWYLAMEGPRIIGGMGVIENDFHVVDVESTDGVAAVISFLEHFGRSNQRHNDISLVYSYSTKNSSKFQLFLQ